MDIKKLQAVVIDALEDVKAQDIKLFDTVHLTSLFDRLVVASGTSNRQTKALAASVRDKVKSNGGDIVSIEGEDTGEWVLVDLGDMIVHIMQPAIRAYYRLEEIWGDKEVSLSVAKRGAKDDTASTAKKSAGKSAARDDEAKPARKTAAKKAPAKKASTQKAATRSDDTPVKKAPARKAAKSPAKSAVKSAAKSATKSATKPATKTAGKTAAKKTPAKKAVRKSAD